MQRAPHALPFLVQPDNDVGTIVTADGRERTTSDILDFSGEFLAKLGGAQVTDLAVGTPA